MNRFRFGLSVALGTSVAIAMIVGCSGDDTVVPVTGDSGSDATTTADNFVPKDSSSSDSSDAGSDTGIVDTGIDAPQLTPTEFLAQSAQGICTKIATCCLAIDAGAINSGKCLGVEESSATIDTELSTVINAADGGAVNVTIDPQGAASCLTTISALPCAESPTTQKVYFNACFGAVRGTLTTGTTCTYNIECAGPAYCKYATPGGPSGVCEPLVAVGGNCSLVGGNVDQQPVNAQGACTERFSGTPAAYCDDFNPDFSYKDAAAWTCTAAEPEDAGCVIVNYCTSLICDGPSGACADTTPLISAGGCGFLQ